MPRSPRRACRNQPCKYFEPCPDHPRVVRQAAATNAYGPEWRRTSKHLLQLVPFCPGYGRWFRKCGRPTEQVDHVKSLRSGGTNDRANLQPYCGRCHRSKTATEDGAFGNTKRPAPTRESAPRC